jgi:F420-non-reducing hydrogenase iron-sulfur subunit
MSNRYEPKILAFLCKRCAYTGADLAGALGFQYPPNIRPLLTMCSGRVDPVFVLEGLRSGFDGVLVFGCQLGDCHYLDGNVYIAKWMQVLRHLLEVAGLGQDRVHLRLVCFDEGRLFADYVTELTGVIREMGPLDRQRLQLPLASVEKALQTMQLRWLMNMERQLTERENVYHEKLDAKVYEAMLRRTAVEEYQKALLEEVLKEGPKTVRQMAEETGLPVYTVSLRLNDLERAGLADVSGHEGTTFKFKFLAA